MRQLRILTEILRVPMYAALAAGIAILVFTGAVWVPNTALILAVLGASSSPVDTIVFLGTLYASIGTNFTVLSATFTIMISALFGVQVALIVFYIAKARANSTQLRGAGTASLGGLISGALGIGCAACGTFVLTTVLTVFGAGGLLAFFPLGGSEFGIIGVVLLLYSIRVTLKKIDAPFVCPI